VVITGTAFDISFGANRSKKSWPSAAERFIEKSMK